MDTDKSWIKFMKSGSVADYLTYVNSCKEKNIFDGATNTIHNCGLGNKGNECRGE
jgi:hypothetical protein